MMFLFVVLTTCRSWHIAVILPPAGFVRACEKAFTERNGYRLTQTLTWRRSYAVLHN
jgi:hypothetical protein